MKALRELARRVERVEDDRGGGIVFAIAGDPDFEERREQARRTGADLVIIRTDVGAKPWDL